MVDDDEGDRALLVAAARETRLKDRIVFFQTGDELLDYLEDHVGARQVAGRRFPLIIMLDLMMPGMDGRQTLEALKSSDMYRKIPVVILSASNDAKHVKACYDLGASSYIVKPDLPDQLLPAIRQFDEYWANTVSLPSLELDLPA